MVGNLASHTVWAMRFTLCVTPALNWWDQTAGFVRKAWPGAASSLHAKVRIQHGTSPIWPQCDGDIPPPPHLILSLQMSLLFFALAIILPVICPSDRFYNPVIILFAASPFLALDCHSSFLCHACHSVFLCWDTFHKWPMIIFPLYVLWSLSREDTECCDMRYSNLMSSDRAFQHFSCTWSDVNSSAPHFHYSLSNIWSTYIIMSYSLNVSLSLKDIQLPITFSLSQV